MFGYKFSNLDKNSSRVLFRKHINRCVHQWKAVYSDAVECSFSIYWAHLYLTAHTSVNQVQKDVITNLYLAHTRIFTFWYNVSRMSEPDCWLNHVLTLASEVFALGFLKAFLIEHTLGLLVIFFSITEEPLVRIATIILCKWNWISSHLISNVCNQIAKKAFKKISPL